MAEKKDVKSKASASSKKTTSVSAAKKPAPKTAAKSAKVAAVKKTSSKPTKKDLEAEIERLKKREERLKLQAIKERERLLAEKEKALLEREKSLGIIPSDDDSKSQVEDLNSGEDEEDSSSPFSFKLGADKVHHHAHIGDAEPEEEQKEEQKTSRAFEEHAISGEKDAKKSSNNDNISLTDAYERYKRSRKESFGNAEATGEFAKRLREEKDAFDAEVKAEEEARVAEEEKNAKIAEESEDLKSDAEDFLKKAENIENSESSSDAADGEVDSGIDDEESENNEETEDEEEEEGEIIYEDDSTESSEDKTEEVADDTNESSEDLSKPEENESKTENAEQESSAPAASEVKTKPADIPNEPTNNEASVEESKIDKEQSSATDDAMLVKSSINAGTSRVETVGKGGGTVQGISLEELRAAMAGEPAKDDNKEMHETLKEASEKSSDNDRAEELIKKANKNYDKEKKQRPAWLQKKMLTNILIASGVGLALIGIIVTIVVVFAGKKPPVVPTANYEIAVASTFKTNVSDGDRISLVGSVITCEYSDGTSEEIEISNDNIINSINDEFEIVSDHILVKDWRTNEDSRTVRILIGKEKGAKTAITYVDVTINKNIMTKIYALEKVNSSLDIDYLPAIMENESLPTFEIFAKYSGLDKDKKLDSSEYILRALYLKSSETMLDVYQNRNKYDEFVSGEKFIIDKNSSIDGSKIEGASRWELWAFAVDADRLIIQNNGEVVATKIETGMIATTAKQTLIKDVYDELKAKDSTKYYNYTKVQVNNMGEIEFFKGDTPATALDLTKYYFEDGKIYVDSEKTIELTSLKKDLYVVYVSNELSADGVRIEFTSNVNIANINYYSYVAFNGRAKVRDNDLTRYIVTGEVQNGKYVGVHVILGYIEI